MVDGHADGPAASGTATGRRPALNAPDASRRSHPRSARRRAFDRSPSTFAGVAPRPSSTATVDEVAAWRLPRSRARQIIDAYDQGGRTPAEVRAALLADYVYGLPAARGALAHAAAGGNAHLLVIGAAEGVPAVHGSEMYALVGQEQPGRSAEQAERDTRIRDIVLDFATGEHNRLWPAVVDRPTSGSVGNMPFEATAHYQAALGLFEGIDRP
ncbi:hypothetical protein PS467_41625 [Streptomyces luomodiensis]|uniref:Uncharacterized protein n=1 Tax=Streptomyces luomodiensis TaxID=3026192 RepID=A0ABY9VAN4_9ACTN|nr:hypothetical protein [Streptomyces sp. SCA4-21]WNF01879.1 hypothetical protein PS467_41625 [Streptomyces sp. SCA4-21]